jgi:hypothetical protein
MAQLSEKATKALSLFEDGCSAYHDIFCEKVKRGHQAYRAILDKSAQARTDWQLKLMPPFVQNIVESTLAGLVDAQFKYKVKPRARFFDPGEYEMAAQGAKAHEILHGHQLACDHFDEKQWPFALQDAICGLTVAKTSWRREYVRRPHLEGYWDAEAGIPRMREVEAKVSIGFDGPTTDVVNVEDFFWHEAAVELQRSPVIAHRVWMHYTDLKANEKSDNRPFGYSNLGDLKDAKGRGEEYSAHRIADGSSRTKDMIEVLEIWWREDDGQIWMVTLGNRKAELKPPRKNPFWHGEYPFVVCSTRPDLFAIPGVSQVEKIAHLQDAHWDLENQMRANVELQNNFIVAVNTNMVTDIDALVHEPGARWPVEGSLTEALQQFTPDPTATTLALPHLARLETQMQNLAGGQPFTTTSESRGVGADTATEAALVTNLAQRATMRLKQQLNYAYGRIGQQRTELNQQFVRTPLAVEVIGLNNESEFQPVMPYLLGKPGEYLFDTTPMNESLMRAERKAEINTLSQILQPWVAIQLQLAQSGAATPLNTDALLEEVIEQNGFPEPKRFFSTKQAPPPQAPGAPQQPGAPEGPGGVTAPQSIDPSVSPSGQASVSPQTMMARALSMGGGVSNT